MKERKQAKKLPQEKKEGTTNKKRFTKDKNPQGTAFDLSLFEEKSVQRSRAQKAVKTEKKEKDVKKTRNTVLTAESKTQKPRTTARKKKPVKIIFLGGVGEIGKNMTAI